jgi:hypothetical protein
MPKQRLISLPDFVWPVCIDGYEWVKARDPNDPRCWAYRAGQCNDKCPHWDRCDTPNRTEGR